MAAIKKECYDETTLHVISSLNEADATGDITLVSSDNVKFTLSKKAAFISKLVKEALEKDVDATEIPIPGAKGNILQLVVNYMVHHDGQEPPIIEKPLRSKKMSEVCKDGFDSEFIDKIGEDRQQLYDFILTTNYMDCKVALHLGCAKVASLIKGQPLEKIQGILAVDQSEANAKKSKVDSDSKEE